MNDLLQNRDLSTTQVARALGLSVSTVKRWVDDGVLIAHKTVGGHRKLKAREVWDFVVRNNIPHFDATLLSGSQESLKETPENLYHAMLQGDLAGTRLILHQLFKQGVSIASMADEWIGPMMHRVGVEWEKGRIGIAQEHQATQTLVAALYELKCEIAKPASRKRPRAMGCAPEGDHSILPTLLAEMILSASDWHATNLGPNMPLASLLEHVGKTSPRPALVWLSISHVEHEERFLKDYHRLYHGLEKLQIPLAIGGSALVNELRRKIPYTTYGDNFQQFQAFANSLSPKPRRPTRGRPRTS